MKHANINGTELFAGATSQNNNIFVPTSPALHITKLILFFIWLILANFTYCLPKVQKIGNSIRYST